MSKIKLSFSLIVALLLVGILSTVAFARDPYGLKPVQGSNLTLIVPFNGNSSASPADVQGTKFRVDLYKDGTMVKRYYATLDASLKASVTIQAGYDPATADIVLDASTGAPVGNYTVVLNHTGLEDAVSSSSAVVRDAHNNFSLPALDTKGSGLVNANQTGFNNTRKQRSGDKVHGFYDNNTNSCASCHQTHTAATAQPGQADVNDVLLMKNGSYSTCASCHDGTMGAKNVYDAVSQDTTNSIDGTFNTTMGHNASIHEADDTLSVATAPGGNHTGTTTNSSWGGEFDCASCHAPHGSGSNGENNLNYDPNGWGTVQYVANGTADQKNGKLFKNIPIYDYDASKVVNKVYTPAAGETTPFILVRFTATASGDTNTTVTSDTTKPGYLWYRAGVRAGDKVLATFRLNGSKGYVPDYSLWLQGTGAALYSDAAATTNITATIPAANLVWKDGFVWGANADAVKSATIAIGIDVETTSNIRSLFDSTYAGYIVDSGTEMSKYCSACHVDYLSATRKDVTGVYTSAHRHQTASDSLTCVRCHYAHGTDGEIMKDANDNSYWDLTTPVGSTQAVSGHAGSGLSSDAALSYLTDPNPSSALKRYTGMSVCFSCHGSGETFVNNLNNHPNKAGVINGNVLLPGKPGTR